MRSLIFQNASTMLVVSAIFISFLLASEFADAQQYPGYPGMCSRDDRKW